MTHAGIDPRHEPADLQEALHRAIVMYRYSCTWTQVPAGWVVAISFPESRRFFGTTLEEAFARCLAWVRAQETRREERRTEWLAAERAALGSCRQDLPRRDMTLVLGSVQTDGLVRAAPRQDAGLDPA
jgi:hypothetical protein